MPALASWTRHGNGLQNRRGELPCRSERHAGAAFKPPTPEGLLAVGKGRHGLLTASLDRKKQRDWMPKSSENEAYFLQFSEQCLSTRGFI